MCNINWLHIWHFPNSYKKSVILYPNIIPFPECSVLFVSGLNGTDYSHFGGSYWRLSDVSEDRPVYQQRHNAKNFIYFKRE